MRFAPVLLALLTTSAMFTTPTIALAGAEPVQVLAVQSDDAVEQAQKLTLALKQAAKQQSAIALVPGDYSLEVLSLALGCPDTPDEACLGKIADKIKAEAFVWGTLEKHGSALNLRLHFFQRGKPNRTTELRLDPEASDDPALNALAERALAKLLGAKEQAASGAPDEETGRLLLSADALSGEIVIDGAPAGEIQNGHAELELPVGEHDVSVRVHGYREAEGTIVVSPGKRALLRLHPEKIGTSHVSQAEGAREDAGSNASAGWGAIAFGGAFAIAGVYSTLRVNSINHDAEFDSYRAGISKNADACVSANRNVVVNGASSPSRISDLCSESKTFEALEYVFFGLGAVAAGTGALILLTDDAPQPRHTDARRVPARRAARLEPRLSVGPHSAAVDLRLRF
jgi:hypothetical protein